MSGPVEAQALYKALEDCFEPWRYTDTFPKMGLQFHNTDHVKRVFLSTFASVPVLERVLAKNERDVLLYTHHPVPPKPDEDGEYGAIPGEVLAEMAARRVSLFSYHIPMDCHSVYSPSRTLAQALGMEPYASFYFQNGGEMGVLCSTGCKEPAQLAARLRTAAGHGVKVYEYGGAALENGRAAVAAGGARNPEIYRLLRGKGVNTLITGVTNPGVSWVSTLHAEAKQHGVTLIGGTHYSTEMFAPKAMAGFFAGLGLESEYIPDEPNLLDL